MDTGRFSLLLLEPGEIYFEDFSAILITPDTTPQTYESKKQIGRLKMCSKSLVFDPKDIACPLIKIPLKDCQIIEQWKGSAKFLKSDNVLCIKTKQRVEMLEGNVIAPYNFCESCSYLFELNYANILDCLPQICQLHRASTLPAAEQTDMIATIVHSRHARVKFDRLWMDLYENILIEAQVHRISPLIVNPGRIVISTRRLYFQPYNNIETYPVLKINLNSIKKIIKRRFLLRHVGLEIYSSDSYNAESHIYLSFRTPLERDNFYSEVLNQPDVFLTEQEQDVMTLQWQNGILSNYDYLLYINSLADRTVNDLTQYPVFPWVISDYVSKILNLNDPKSFRDLTKPIGALNEERLQRLMERYEEMSFPKFIYGSHYSTPGFVLFYIVRLYPNFMLCLQNGRFDHPDRMFNSVADVYKNCLNNMSDFKELIPEFYDTEQEGKFLVNNLGINFGYRHDGVKVGDVELPPWCESPKDFVNKLREALESDYVSENLHSWIDLIFGYKQRGDEAIKAKNLFYYLCYEGKVDLDSITDLNQRHALEVQIMEFGQIPKQVFTVPHPKRKSKISSTFSDTPLIKSTEVDNKRDIWRSIEKLDLVTSFSSHKEAVSALTIAEDNVRIISVGHDSKLKVFSLSQNRQIRSANIGTMPLSSLIQLPNKNVIVIGSYDNNIIVYDLDFGREVDNLLAHEDTVTCMAWGVKSQLLVSGSGDCTIRIWKGFLAKGTIRATQSLVAQLDHNSHINCICFNEENTYIASGTDDGEIYIWDIENQNLLKKLCVHSGGVQSVSFSPDGQKLVSCGKDKIFQVLDLSTGMALFYKTLPSEPRCLKWDNNLLLLGSDDGTLYIWDLVEVKLLYELPVHTGPVRAVDLSSDKTFIVTGGEDHQIKVWKPSEI